MTELWASVLEIEAGRGRDSRVRLEVHDDGKVYEIGTTTQIPRGSTLQVGDHVALASLKQLTKAEARRSPGDLIRDEVKSELAFEFLPWWMPFGRKDDRWDNGEHPSWKINWGAVPQYDAPQPAPVQTFAPPVAPATPSLEQWRASGQMSGADYLQAVAVRDEARTRLNSLHAAGTLTEEQYQVQLARLP